MPFYLTGMTRLNLVALLIPDVLCLTFYFLTLGVEFVRRQANGVAHALARDVALLASSDVYYDIPDCIESLIINEML